MATNFMPLCSRAWRRSSRHFRLPKLNSLISEPESLESGVQQPQLVADAFKLCALFGCPAPLCHHLFAQLCQSSILQRQSCVFKGVYMLVAVVGVKQVAGQCFALVFVAFTHFYALGQQPAILGRGLHTLTRSQQRQGLLCGRRAVGRGVSLTLEPRELGQHL